MKFDVTVQGRFYKTIAAKNTGAVLTQITQDIATGLVPEFDHNAPHNIVIKPQPRDTGT